MKEWRVLLKHIDHYVYDVETEAICFDNSAESKEAEKLYDVFLSYYDIKAQRYLKWSFDIALDCIRKMKEEDRTYLYESYDVSFFGYGLYIRNNYIHNSRLHRCLMPDGQCGTVLSLIYTILHRYYNCFNKELSKLLNDYEYEKVYKIYSAKYPFIEEEVLKLAEPNCNLTAREVYKRINTRIRVELGKNGFKDILVSVVKECGKDCLPREKWINFQNKLYDKGVVYRREYNQISALREIGLINDLVGTPLHEIKSKNDCKVFIDDNLGLSEEDSVKMADALWTAFKEE